MQAASFYQLALFALLGVLCGFGAAFFFWLFVRFSRYIDDYDLSSRRVLLCIVAVFAINVVAYPFENLRSSDRMIASELFDESDLDEAHWVRLPTWITLPLYIIFKLTFTAISICLPIPCGVLTPIFTCGAAFGRLFGEMLGVMSGSIQPGIYALVGAAALSSGVTHTLSIIIIVFEVTGELKHMVPVLTAVVFAYTIAGSFSPSIYDLILETRGLPDLQLLENPHTSDKLLKNFKLNNKIKVIKVL